MANINNTNFPSFEAQQHNIQNGYPVDGIQEGKTTIL
jgi:hypothetical protein